MSQQFQKCLVLKSVGRSKSERSKSVGSSKLWDGSKSGRPKSLGRTFPKLDAHDRVPQGEDASVCVMPSEQTTTVS